MAMKLKSELNRAYSLICKKLSEPNVSPWLRDNFYIIDKHYSMLSKNKKAFLYGEMYGIIEKYCAERDYSVQWEDFAQYLKSLNRDFEYYSLCAVKPLLSACGIITAGNALLGKGKGIDSLPAAIKLLISLADPQFDFILPTVWTTEAVIADLEEDYKNSDEETKSQYREYIAKYAKRNRISETNAVKRLYKTAKEQKSTIGKTVFAPQSKYAFAWWGVVLGVFCSLLAMGLLLVDWISLLLIVPFGLSASAVADWVISKIVSPYRAPRLKTENIPDDSKTLVTIAALMQGKDGDKEVFESLERFAYMNPNKNIYFCLLADLPDSESQFHLEDNKIISDAKTEIDRLNSTHGERFCLFFRERVLNKSENRYGGWERKRGAVCQLVNHIVNGGANEYYGGEFIRDIKYILTLDSDTNLSVGTVSELVSVARHSANKPVVVKNRVVSGYGIIQPVIRTELQSAYKTSFSRLISGAGGADIYANAEFKRSQSLFGSCNFCGKGLIDVALFQSMVCGRFPEGVVLSHDCPEGSIIRTLCVSDISLTDSTPGNTVSFFKRQHRWIRGDFQNLIFLKSNLFGVFYKLRLVASVLRHSSPIFTLLAIICGAFLSGRKGFWLFVLAYSEFFLPYLISTLSFLLSGSPFACRRYFSKSVSLLSQTAKLLFFELSASCRKALLALNAFWLAAVRLLTKKKTLEWTTAAQTEKISSNLGKYVLDSWLSAVVGLIIFAFAKSPFIRLCGVLYFVYPLVSANLSQNLGGGEMSNPKLSQKQKDILTSHVSAMLGFYLDNVNETTNYLPPDNIQISPVSAIAYRTSPTNIGFYLLALLSARDLGAINSKELYNMLDSSLATIEKLEKFKGNLYNWYDIKTLSVLGDPYVSAVDCGNFIVMLVALKEGLLGYSETEPKLLSLAERCQKLIDNADIAFLYNENRGLFPIGYNPKTEKFDNGYYDMLISEARMLAYYSVASNTVPKKHWRSLGRTLTHKYGYMGLISWSGTAFEYLMPQLFLPLYRDSFLYESIAFSVMVQKAENKIWGVSESGYYAFDSDMNYQYKANGIQTLALRRISNNEKVISPYSTYLSLCVCGNSVMKNLRALDNRGMFGKYGFYEALDFNNDSGGLTVKSYMAHHVGMSIVACMNAINDNIFVRRFLSDRRMGSAKELLMEKIPIESHVFENDKNVFKAQKNNEENNNGTLKDNTAPNTVLLTRGNMSAVISSLGHIGLYCGERMITNTHYDISELRFSPTLIFSRGGQHYGCSPLYGGDSDYSFRQSDSSASHIASGRDFNGRVSYSFSKNCDCFVVNTRAETLKKYDITFAFRPVLQEKKRFLSHISFSNLFVESEYDSKEHILYFHRRSGSDGRHIFSSAIALKEKIQMNFATSLESVLASSINSPFDYLDIEPDKKVGACIDPLCLLKIKNADSGKATILITCGANKNECTRNIQIARKDNGEFRSNQTDITLGAVLTSMLYNTRGKKAERFSNCHIGDLWGRQISGDYPFVVVDFEKTATERLKTVITAFVKLTSACLRSELVVIAKDDNAAEISTTLANNLGGSKYLNRGGGIFVLDSENVPKELLQALRQNAHYQANLSTDIAYTLDIKTEKRQIVAKPQNALTVPLHENSVRSNCGYFSPSGFVVDKSQLPNAPYSYILTGYRFSSVLTQSSLGYTFYDNARERRLCSFFGDSKTLDNGERIFLIHRNKKYDLCAISNKVSFEKGRVIYYGEVDGNEFTLTVTIHPKYPVKLVSVSYSKSEKDLETVFELNPVMGDSIKPVRGIEVVPFKTAENQCIMFKNTFGMTFPEGIGFAGVVGGNSCAEECCLKSISRESLFFLGACTTEMGATEVASRIHKAFFDNCLTQAYLFADSMVPKIKIKTDRPDFDYLFNYFVPYQISACRFYARGSFYQSGGAYGFRDQLQDCLSIIYSSPKTVRIHIIRCCAHQYSDGSVMHWWHTRNYNRVNRGIKSKCSDDLLYLPFVTADYLEKTQDYGVLDVNVGYLTSPPLGNLSERYEQPEKSGIKESVYNHCLKVLETADKRGKHGLILMGSCDWNDAFSLVGEKGVGESVFSTLLYVISAQSFIPVMEYKGDTDSVNKYKAKINELKDAVETNAFFGDRYARAFCDDGSILGVDGCKECEIDILSQAFAAIAGLKRERVEIALKTAFEKLYNSENKIFRLFSPPFKDGKTSVGYIRGYVSGIRENGGQYTHGALWGALGYIIAGMKDEALKLLDCADPTLRSSQKELAKKYKNEPYVLSADIYFGQWSGRGGWSWYTGSAAWFYRIWLENVFGLKMTVNGVFKEAKPLVPFQARLEFPSVKLNVTASEKVLKPLLNKESVKFPIKLPYGNSQLELPLEK